MMRIYFPALVRRHLKRGGRFHHDGSLPDDRIRGMFSPTETLVGWYQNPEPWASTTLVFTDHAIYQTEETGTRRVELDEITGHESPTSKTVTGIKVFTRRGEVFLRAAGMYGPQGTFSDAFALLMILRSIGGPLS
jgi:hypothetical protein